MKCESASHFIVYCSGGKPREKKAHKAPEGLSYGLTSHSTQSQHNALKYYFFPRTVTDWNHLDGDIISAPTVPLFEVRLKNDHQ